MVLSTKQYKFLKWFCILCLPACATLYRLLADTWGLPYGDKVVTTINGVATFLGVIVGVSNYKYYKGDSEGEE